MAGKSDENKVIRIAKCDAFSGVCANQFNNLAHSGANHLVRGNISVRLSIEPCQHSDCSWFHGTDQKTLYARHFNGDSGSGGGCS